MILRPLIISTLLCVTFMSLAQAPNFNAHNIDSLKTALKLNPQDNLLTFVFLATYYNKVHNDSAALYLSKAKNIFLVSNNIEIQFKILKEEYRFSLNKGKVKQQIRVSKRRLKLTRKFKNKTYILQSYTDLTAAYIRARKKDSATYFFELARKLRPSVSNKETLGDFYGMAGFYYGSQGNFDLSLESSMEALRLYDEVNERYSAIRVYNNIGVMFLNSRKYRKAIEIFKKAQYLIKEDANQFSNYNNLLNLSKCYTGVKELKIASEHAQKALVLSKAIGNELYIALVFSQLAFIAHKEGKFKSAVEYNSIALKIYTKNKKYFRISLTLTNMAEAHLMRKEFAIANAVTKEALSVSKKHSLIKRLPSAYGLLSKIDSAQGNYLSSLTNYKRSIAISDSLQQNVDTKNFNELQVKYTTLEKEKEIVVLNSANKTQELKIKSQRYENYILWCVSIFFLVGITNVFFQYRTKKKNNLLLSEKNLEIQVKNQDLQQKSTQLVSALQDKDVLIKEIHHRVKNSLQLITSLLSLQAERMNSKKIEAFVSRSQHRIASMALVHEVLYKGNKMKQINFHQYLLRLVEAAYDSFDFSNKKITYEIEAKGILFEVETATPLGIIINELVHNAFKHAFRDKTNGKVTISVTKNQELYQILVKDNGAGIPKNGGYHQKSYGLKLVSLLMKQLKGTIVQSQKEGTSFEIQFTPKPLILNPNNDEKENPNCRR